MIDTDLVKQAIARTGSAEALAERLGVVDSTVRRWRDGTTKLCFRNRLVLRLCLRDHNLFLDLTEVALGGYMSAEERIEQLEAEGNPLPFAVGGFVSFKTWLDAIFRVEDITHWRNDAGSDVWVFHLRHLVGPLPGSASVWDDHEFGILDSKPNAMMEHLTLPTNGMLTLAAAAVE